MKCSYGNVFLSSNFTMFILKITVDLQNTNSFIIPINLPFSMNLLKINKTLSISKTNYVFLFGLNNVFVCSCYGYRVLTFSTLQAFSSRVSVLYLSPSIIDAISPFLFLLFLELYLPHFRSYNQNTVIPWLLSL